MKYCDFYVYSGTGNTYRVARLMEEQAKEKGLETSLHMIDAYSEPKKVETGPDRFLGLLSPTIGTVQPMSFMAFILRLPRGKGTKAFLAATGAWTRIGRLFAPGFIGLTLYIAAILLLIKGYKVVGVMGFGMAHNWTALLPPYPQRTEEKIGKEIVYYTRIFTDRIFNGKRSFNRFLDVVIGIPLLPLSLVFILLAHLVLAKSMFATDKCNGCGNCARNCPRKAIKLLGAQKRPFWTYRCEQCMRCVGFCPQKAVVTHIPYLIILNMFFFALPLEYYSMLAARAILGNSSSLVLFLFSMIILYFGLLLAFAAIYWLFILLNRMPLFNKLFSKISISNVWRRYKEPGVQISELISNKK